MSAVRPRAVQAIAAGTAEDNLPVRAFLVQLLMLLAAFSSEDDLVVSICGGVHRHALQQLLHWRRSVQQLCGMGAMRASLSSSWLN